MTIAKDFASKFSVALVAIAMLLWSVAPAFAAEDTSEDMQTTINDLLAQVAALQADLAGNTPATAVSCSTFARDLRSGSVGADVMELQKLLNSDADTRVAAAGAGSAGMETMTFGPLTMAAVSKFQVKYRAEILTPAGLVNPTGFFGPSSRSQANKLCANAPDGGDDDDQDDADDDDSDDDSDDDDMELSGEGSLDMFEIDDASDDTIEEGQEDAEIAEVTLEAQDGDIMITRMDVSLETTGTDDPWEVFDTISLWVDGEMVAEMDASDEDEYLDEDDFSLRFSGLDIVAMEDEELEILIGASIQDGVDDVPADWTIEVNEVRYFDADDVSTDDDSTEDLGSIDGSGEALSASFSIEMEGDGDELSVRTSSEDPDATTIELEDDEKSEWVTIFAFELDAGDSDGDVTVNGLTVTVDATSNGTLAASSSLFIADAMIVIDGEEYDDYDLAGSSMNDEYVFDFDDEAMIDADGMATVEFKVEFKSLALANEGATVQASVVDTADAGTDVDVDAESEGGEDLAVDGSATGEEHTLRTSGAILEAGDMSEVIKANTDTVTTDDEGVFKIEFDVTAFEDDLYVDDTALRGTVETDTGVNFQILSGGSATTTGSAIATLDSDAEMEGARFLVEEGSTETFTLTVEYDPAITGSYKLQLYSLNFNTVNADADKQQRANPEEDFDTDSLTI